MSSREKTLIPLIISHSEVYPLVYKFELQLTSSSFEEIYEKIHRLYDKSKLDEIIKGCNLTLEELKKFGFNFLTYFDDLYPRLLREISHPPLALFYRGNPEIFKLNYIGVVGTRKPSPISLSATVSFVELLRERQETGLISGLAQGIDREAMETAIRLQIPVIGVMGTGFDKEYPPTNRDLYRSMKSNTETLLLTEMRPADKIGKWSFPRRNRIISGISESIAIMEAPLESGAMSTASHALSQNRDILVFSDTAQKFNSGGQKLIEDGAGVLKGEDLNNRSKLLHISDIFPDSPTQISKSIAMLTRMELEGKVRDRGGGYFEFL